MLAADIEKWSICVIFAPEVKYGERQMPIALFFRVVAATLSRGLPTVNYRVFQTASGLSSGARIYLSIRLIISLGTSIRTVSLLAELPNQVYGGYRVCSLHLDGINDLADTTTREAKQNRMDQ